MIAGNTYNRAWMNLAPLDLIQHMSRHRKATHHFYQALRDVRLARRMSQTDFDAPSSQRYISELERQVKVPSLAKIEELSGSLSVHPLTMLVYSYLNKPDVKSLHALVEIVESELTSLELVGTPDKPAVKPARLLRG
jgi:transcriptional regulator with XRE-family HTH domain